MSSGANAFRYAPGALPSWDAATPYRAGDMIHPDCYGYVDGYMYDVQRTMIVGAEPTRRQRWLMDGAWEQAQMLGALLRDGITCREIYEAGVRFMKDAGYDRDAVTPPWQAGGHFGHGYASGFDWPWLGIAAPGADDPLVAPFAVTIELWWGEPEHGAAWAVPVLAFGHGSLSVQNRVMWARGKEWGGWWPPERPAKFFRPVEPEPEVAAAKYDPAFRLPLYEAAFHDAVVSTDRWDVPLAKFPSLLKRRLLLELLYGAPSMWAMDRRQVREQAPLLGRLAAFFEPLHREFGPLPLTAFEWLTPDRLVQRTRFGPDVSLTANFGAGAFQGLSGGCVEAKSPRMTRLFCP